jgi:hypothetical protein
VAAKGSGIIMPYLRRQTLYVKDRLTPEQRLQVCKDFVLKETKPNGTS